MYELTYNLKANDTYEVTGYTGEPSEVVIPSTYEGKSVTSIADGAFKECISLISVTIGDNVTSIGERAFAWCRGLVSVTIPAGGTLMDYQAFYSCNKLVEVINKSSLSITKGSTSNGHVGYYALEVHNGESKIDNKDGYLFITSEGVNYLLGYIGDDTVLTLPDKYNGENYEIYEQAFYSRKYITSVTIGNGVTSIGAYAFYNCGSLMSITIPGSIISMGGSAFYNCYNLMSVTIREGATTIGSGAFYQCTHLGSVVIPDSVTSIGDNAFSLCYSLTSITVADNNQYYMDVDGNLYSKDGKTLIQYAIGKTNINFIIPNRVTSICNYAFRGCTSLESVTIPNNVTSIGHSAFLNCSSLTSVTIPNSVTSIGGSTFSNCTSLTSVTIPNSVTSISNLAFDKCYKLFEVINKSILNIEAGSTTYGYVARYAIEVHNGESKIDNKDGYLFYTYSGTNYLIGYSGTDTEIALPDKYNGENYKICSSAFRTCPNLVSVTIPASVAIIDYQAFMGGPFTIYCEAASKPSGWNSTFAIAAFPIVWDYKNNDIASDGYIYVIADGVRYALKDGIATVVSQSKSIETANITSSITYKNVVYTVTTIRAGAFSSCTSLKSVTIPDSVTSIGNSAFEGCTSLKSVTIGDSVTSIGYSAFQDCTSLKSVTIPDSVTSIGYSAFEGCTSLPRVTIPNSVTSIGKETFQYCYSLLIYCEAASQPDGWNSTWNYSACPVVWGYIYVIIDGVCYEIKDEVAAVGVQPKSIKIANIASSIIYENVEYSVTSIDDEAFKDCTSLTSVTIPESVTSINASAFEDCTALKSITLLNESPASMDSGCFTNLPESSKFYCFSSAIESYKTATNWNAYAAKFVADDMRLYFAMSAAAQRKYFATQEEVKKLKAELSELRAAIEA